MAAIDLLLNWSPTSERMHQVVLAGLFEHTRLLELLGIPGAPGCVATETQGKLYDFTVGLDNGRRVHIELKVDAFLDKLQMERQMAAATDGDWLLYVLLGTCRFSWSESKIEVARQRCGRAPAADCVRVVDLRAMRDAVATLASHATDPDHSDLAVAYGRLLRQIDDWAGQYDRKPLAEWKSLGSDWYGFYDKLVRDMKLPDAEILKVNNRRGGFIGCWWDISSLPLSPGAEAYLQLEEKLLCFKVSVDQKEDRSRVRQAFSEAVLAAARDLGFRARRPKFRSGAYMTVAVYDGEYRTGPSGTTLDWDQTRSTIAAARDVLAVAVGQCGAAGERS